ncbi:MAG: conjugal transfer protein MobB [Paludibacter sp.]|nr:conjugal transfer protein MobB [Paludibacter sp.]
MVAKISIGSSLYGALAYNGEKINEGKGKLLVTNKVFDNGTGKIDIHRVVEDFKCYMPPQVRTEKPVIHISLNPHPDDKLTDVELADIAREYMEKLGYGNQPYTVYKHEDIDRKHLHIVSIRVDENGKCLNNAYNFHRSKAITRELEQKYGLHTAERQRETKQEPVKKVNLSDGNVKKQLGNVVKCLMRYRFQSLGEYRALLSLYNVTVEEVKGEVRGREYHGMVYSATDDKGNKVGNPFKSSQLGKAVGYEAFEKHIAFSKKQIREKKFIGQTKIAVTTALTQTTNRTEFIAALKAKGIDTLFRETEMGRIYGATFIDHNTGCVFNGSRLGKEFSANALQEHFVPDPMNKNSQTSDKEELFEKKTFPEQEQPFSQQNDFSEGSLGLLSFDAQDTNAEEEALIWKMKRKKKKKQQRKM